MEFKKVNIFETYGKKIYSDQYGPMNNDNISISILDNTSNQWYDENSLFLKTGKTYERLRDKYQSIDITKIFGRKLFVLNHNYRNRYGYYGYNRNTIPQNDEQAEGINFSKIKIGFRNWSIEIDKSDKQAFNIDVWVADSNDWELRRVKYHQLKIGNLIYCNGLNCTCEVCKIFEPNPQNELCVIKPLHSSEQHIIKSDNRDIYWVPYEEHKGELAIFNEMSNELALAPFVIKDENIRNIFWQPVEEASQYIVSIYKLYSDRNNECKERLYHLNDYNVDRNTCCLKVKDLIGGDYIITVSAENRGGEIIAKSRGIHDSGFPEFWREF